MSTATRGSITTFYSYKGGTGRTMALANVAWVLASNGKRVLVVDWDLEAPGLHRYFSPFLSDPNLSQTEGLMDWAYEYLIAATEPEPEREGAPRGNTSHWSEQYAALDGYATSLDWKFQGNGCIHLVGAGMQNAKYSERVNRFDWFKFYAEFGGKAFIDGALEQARQRYDHILIDSRTGVADTSGICTIQAPDTLVTLFTLNNQSIEGTAEVARNVAKVRANDGRAARIVPVATRVEFAEDERLGRRLARAQARFRSFLDGRNPVEHFGKLQVQYVPYYAYEEILATVKETPRSDHPVLRSFLALAKELDGTITELPDISAAKRAEALAGYARASASADDSDDSATSGLPAGDTPANAQQQPASAAEAWDVFISYPHYAVEEANALYLHLASRCRAFIASQSIGPGVDRERAILAARRGAKTHVILVGPRLPDAAAWYAQEVQGSLERRAQSGAPAIVPVLLKGGRATDYLAPLLQFQSVFLEKNGERKVADAILGSLGLQNDDSSKHLLERTVLAEARAAAASKTFLNTIMTAGAVLIVAVAAAFVFASKQRAAEAAAADAVAKAEVARRTFEMAQESAAREQNVLKALQTEQASVGERGLEAQTAANDALQKAIAAPQDVSVIAMLEEASTKLEAAETAVTEFDKKLDASEISADSKKQLRNGSGVMLSTLRQTAGALAKMGSALRVKKVDPAASARTKAQALWRNGYALFNDGAIEDARKNYQAAIDADPTYAPAINSLGLLEYNQKNYANADKLFERTLAADPTYAPAHANHALSLFRLGNTDKARLAANKALELRPGYTPATEALALIDGSTPVQKGPTEPKPQPLTRCGSATFTMLEKLKLDPKATDQANTLCRSLKPADLADRPTEASKGDGVAVNTGKVLGKTPLWCLCK